MKISDVVSLTIAVVAILISVISTMRSRAIVRRLRKRQAELGEFAVPGGIIRPGRELSKREIAEFRRRWEVARQAPRAAHREFPAQRGQRVTSAEVPPPHRGQRPPAADGDA